MSNNNKNFLVKKGLDVTTGLINNININNLDPQSVPDGYVLTITSSGIFGWKPVTESQTADLGDYVTIGEFTIASGTLQTQIDTKQIAGDYALGDELTTLSGILQIQIDGKQPVGDYEPADPTILKDADIGSSVQAYNADTVVDGSYIHTDNNYSTTEKNKLFGIEDGAEVNNISDVNAIDLTDTGDSNLHYHSSDRDRANHTGTQTAATISDFDTEVSNNSDVSANTSARHIAVSVTDSSEIDFTLTDQDITATIISGSITESKLNTSINDSLDLADSAIQFNDLSTLSGTLQIQIDNKQSIGDYAVNSTVTTLSGALQDQIDLKTEFEDMLTLSGTLQSEIATKQNTTITGSTDYFDIDTVEGAFQELGINKQFWENNNSAGRLYGGVISDAGAGAVNITAGAGLIKKGGNSIDGDSGIPTNITEGQGSDYELVTWDAQSNFSLAGVGYNLIYWDASAGQFAVSLKENFYSVFNFVTDFTVGRVYYDGSAVLTRLCGMNRWNFDRRVQMFGEERFPVERAYGLAIGETGTRNLTMTAGVIWAELVNRFSIDSIDTSGTDTFTYWYRDGSGGWTSVTGQTQIDNTQYDDGSGTLSTLSNNEYGVHWVYVNHIGDLHVVYGQDSYRAVDIDGATVPAIIPGMLAAYASLIGKISIRKNLSSFNTIQSAFETVFNNSSIANHNELSNLQGGGADEYYHLTSTEHYNLLTLSGTLMTTTALKYLTLVNEGDDAGVLCSEDFSVGSPGNPAKITLGEGVAYGVGKEDTVPDGVPVLGSAWHCSMANTSGLTITSAIDVTEIFSSDDNSTVGLFNGTDTGNYILVGSEYSYGGLKAKITSSGTVEPDNVVAEFLGNNVPTWREAHYMATNAYFPYNRMANNIATMVGEEQWYFGSDPLDFPPSWDKVTLNINGTDYTKYWARFRITSDITTDPVIEQLKLHTNKFKINPEGNAQYFGLARYKKSLQFGVKNLITNNVDVPSNQQVTYETSECIANYSNNKFTSNAIDTSLLIQSIYSELDTSIPLLITLSYYGTSATAGDVEWEFDVYDIKDGFVYDGSAVPRSYSKIDSIAAGLVNVRRTLNVTIPVYMLGDNSAIVVKIKRDSSVANTDDTYGGDIILTDFHLYGFCWR